MRILLSPHNDDDALSAAIIIQRLRPLLLVVVTDSFIQAERGDPITWQQRRLESCEAAKVLGVPICFLGLADARITEESLLDALSVFDPVTTDALAPAFQGGNAQHDLVSRVADRYFTRLSFYATYAKGQHRTPIGGVEFVPSEHETLIKNVALDCYASQIKLASTRPHFDAARGKPEYLLERI